jgi:hypothetical protein
MGVTMTYRRLVFFVCMIFSLLSIPSAYGDWHNSGVAHLNVCLDLGLSCGKDADCCSGKCNVSTLKCETPPPPPHCDHPADSEYVAANPSCLRELNNVAILSYETSYRKSTEGRKIYGCQATMSAAVFGGPPEVDIAILPYESDDSANNLCALLREALISKSKLTLEAVSTGLVGPFMVWKAKVEGAPY